MTASDYPFVLENLVWKDFKIRYRNMSLGVLWSLLNPLIMMGVLVFVFTHVFAERTIHAFPVFLLCGLVPFNFFTVVWSAGMVCVSDNAGLVKRVAIPRVLLPLSNVLANCIHMLIQVGILLAFVLAFGFGINRYWTLLPFVWLCEVAFVLGLVMATSAIDVFVRDLRYIVESVIRLMFWAVPIFYSIESIPLRFRPLYEYNPVAALTIALRAILMQDSAPAPGLLLKLGLSSLVMLAAGWFTFRSLQRRFYEQL